MRLICVAILLIVSTRSIGQIGCSIDYGFGGFLNEEVDKISGNFIGYKFRAFVLLKRDRLVCYYEWYEGNTAPMANPCFQFNREYMIEGYGLEYDWYLYKGDCTLDGFYFLGRIGFIEYTGDLSSMGEEYVGKVNGSSYSFGIGIDANLTKHVALFFHGIYSWPTIYEHKANVIDYCTISLGLSFKLSKNKSS